MQQTLLPSQYLQIALDIAERITKGEFPEGSRIYGRSLMASEYGVSPETVRRALRLLADMKVVEVKPQSGATVLSADNAKRYKESFAESSELRSLRARLKALMDECQKLHGDIEETVTALAQGRETFAAANEPLPNYELHIPDDSPLIGKSIGELNFWQSTGSTIVAIKRKQTVILSPGPYAELYDKDVIVLVGTLSAINAARKFIGSK